jgi:hypothetical protein
MAVSGRCGPPQPSSPACLQKLRKIAVLPQAQRATEYTEARKRLETKARERQKGLGLFLILRPTYRSASTCGRLYIVTEKHWGTRF